jgi:hypothetical protein
MSTKAVGLGLSAALAAAGAVYAAGPPDRRAAADRRW